MNFTFYKDLLSENQLRYQLITQLKYGIMNDFIEQLPRSYRKVIQNNKIFFWGAEDHYYTLEPQSKWIDINKTDNDSTDVSIEDVKQQLYSQLIKGYIVRLKDEFHTWRLKLIDSKENEYISNELNRVSERLSYFESVINDLAYLKPYYEDIKGSFKFLKDEIEAIKRHFIIGSEAISIHTNYPFKIREDGKVNIIRLLNVLHDLRIIVNNDEKETIPSKLQYMKRFGEFFNDDFSSYQSNLNLSGTTLETHLNIFKDLLDRATKQINDRNK